MNIPVLKNIQAFVTSQTDLNEFAWMLPEEKGDA